jgi:choline transport protein
MEFEHEPKQQVDGVVATDLPHSDSPSTVDVPINASGHKQELERNFGFINICGLALTSGNTWIALGGSIVSDSFHWVCSIDLVIFRFACLRPSHN